MNTRSSHLLFEPRNNRSKTIIPELLKETRRKTDRNNEGKVRSGGDKGILPRSLFIRQWNSRKMSNSSSIVLRGFHSFLPSDDAGENGEGVSFFPPPKLCTKNSIRPFKLSNCTSFSSSSLSSSFKKKKRRKERKYSHFILLFKNIHPLPFSFFISFRRSSSRKQTRNSCFPSTETTRLLVEYAKYTSIIRSSPSLSPPLLYQHARTPSISVTSRRACRNLTSVVSLDCFSNALLLQPLAPLGNGGIVLDASRRRAHPVSRSFNYEDRAKHGRPRVKVERRISCYRIVNDVNENHRNC